MTTQNNNEWEEVDLDIPTFYKPKVKSEYPKALTVALLILGTVIMLLFAMKGDSAALSNNLIH